MKMVESKVSQYSSYEHHDNYPDYVYNGFTRYYYFMSIDFIDASWDRNRDDSPLHQTWTMQWSIILNMGPSQMLMISRLPTNCLYAATLILGVWNLCVGFAAKRCQSKTCSKCLLS